MESYQPKSKKEAIHNWTEFNVSQKFAESLVANKFNKPTTV
jgi:ATP-dependent RNA helicase DDX24/MAK5